MIHILACVVTLLNCADYTCLYCFMSITHSINGIPACANKKLLTDIARQEWNFTGYIVSDQGAIGEMVSPQPHSCSMQYVAHPCHIIMQDL